MAMETTTQSLSEHPWMRHEETGHIAQLPDLPYWRANGWSPCDAPPPEPDLTRELLDPEAPPSAGLLAAKPKKTTKAAKSEPADDSAAEPAPTDEE